MTGGPRTTPTPTPQAPSAGNDWYVDSAYLDARLREARRQRSAAFGQMLADGWQALTGIVRGMMTSRHKLVAHHRWASHR